MTAWIGDSSVMEHRLLVPSAHFIASIIEPLLHELLPALEDGFDL
jgi:hypothetical protein